MFSKRKTPIKLAAPAVKQSAKTPSRTRIDETRTTVALSDALQTASPGTAETIEISSDSESDYDDLSDAEGEKTSAKAAQPKHLSQRTQQPTPDDTARSIPKSRDVDMLDPSQAEDSDEEPSAPTFGDLIRNHETIDVTSQTVDVSSHTPAASGALTIATPKSLAPPSLASLGTVLSQALRTDDIDLLESCLHTTDLNTVRSTIQRLDSNLAGILLTKLASRMHRRPGRAHTLMSWVQWTLVAHGGALASQPDIQKRLSELNRVLEERSRGLTSLLALKGKLDMLEAQMTLRRTNRTRRSHGRGAIDSDEDDLDEDDEDGVIYVEGEEDDANRTNGIFSGRRDFEDDEFPAVNGAGANSEDDSEDEDEDDMDVDLDLAEESLDEDEVDHDDVEESGEEDESEPEAAAPPAKVQKKAAAAFSKRR